MLLRTVEDVLVARRHALVAVWTVGLLVGAGAVLAGLLVGFGWWSVLVAAAAGWGHAAAAGAVRSHYTVAEQAARWRTAAQRAGENGRSWRV